METNRIFTDKQPFYFPQRRSSLHCLDNGCCSQFHFAGVEGTLWRGQPEMGLWGALSIGAGYFMHLNTSSGSTEEAALLESRILYPKRKEQCLQFFYRMTGSPSDRLVVWVRRDDGTGNVRKLVKVKTFQGTWRD